MNFYITPKEYEIAQKNGISRHTLEVRVWDLLWDKKRAITESPQVKNFSNKKWADKAEKNGIKRSTFYARVRRGMTPQEASWKPLQDKKAWSSEMRERRSFKYPVNFYESAKKNGIGYSSLVYRLKSGNFTEKEAYTRKPLTGKECAERAHEARRSRIGV